MTWLCIWYDNDWGKICIRNDIHKSPYIALTGELWGVFCEEFGENWPRYNGIALYVPLDLYNGAWCTDHYLKQYIYVKTKWMKYLQFCVDSNFTADGRSQEWRYRHIHTLCELLPQTELYCTGYMNISVFGVIHSHQVGGSRRSTYATQSRCATWFSIAPHRSTYRANGIPHVIKLCYIMRRTESYWRCDWRNVGVILSYVILYLNNLCWTGISQDSGGKAFVIDTLMA